MPQPLIEQFTLNPGTYRIVENDGKGNLPKGVLMRIGPIPVSECGVKNANGRRYTEDLWKGVCESADIRSKVEARKMLGELDHPDTDRPTKLEHVSHVIPTMELKGGKVFQTFDVIATPKGKIAAAIVDAQIPLGVSTRGYGDMKVAEDGVNEVQAEGFIYETTDFVADPSAGLFASLSEDKRRRVGRALTESIQSDPLADTVHREYYTKFAKALGVDVMTPAAQTTHESSEDKGDDEMSKEQFEALMTKLNTMGERLTVVEVGLDNLGDKKAAPFGKKDGEDDDKKDESGSLSARLKSALGESDDTDDDDDDDSTPPANEAREVYEKRLNLAERVVGELRGMLHTAAAQMETLVSQSIKMANIIEKTTGTRPSGLLADQIRAKIAESDDSDADDDDKKKDEVAIGGGADPDGQKSPDGNDPDSDKSSKDGYTLGGKPDPDGQKDPAGRKAEETDNEDDDSNDDDSKDEASKGKGGSTPPPANEGDDSEDDDETEDNMDESARAHPAFANVQSLVESVSRVAGGARTGGDTNRRKPMNERTSRIARMNERLTGHRINLDG